MSDNRSLSAQSFVFPRFENLEQRLLLTTLDAGHFFIYHNSAGQNVRVSLYGDAGTSAELFAYDGMNPDSAGETLPGLVDLVGLMDGSVDAENQVKWADGSDLLSSTNRWVEYAAATATVPIVRGSRTEIYAIYLSNANENTVLTITELNSTQPVVTITATSYTDIRSFTGGSALRLAFDRDYDGEIDGYVHPLASSGGVLVGAVCDPIEASGTPPAGGNPVAFSAVHYTANAVVDVAPWGVFPGGDLNAGITVASDPESGDPVNVGKIIIGGTVAGTVNMAGSIGTLEMGFIWGRVNIGQNLGEMIVRQGGGAMPNPLTGSGEPTYVAPRNYDNDFDSYIEIGGHAQEITTLGGTLFSIIQVDNDPDVVAPSNAIVTEVEDFGSGAATASRYWIQGRLNDVINDSQATAELLSSSTSNFYVYGSLATSEPASFAFTYPGYASVNYASDWYGVPLFAGQTVTISGIGTHSTDPAVWADPFESLLYSSVHVHLYDSSGRLVDTLGWAALGASVTDSSVVAQDKPLTFTAPAAGIYYLVAFGSSSDYTLQITNGPAATLGAVRAQGSINGWFAPWDIDNAPTISVANGGTIGAVKVGGSDAWSVTRTLGSGTTGGNIIAYEAGSMSGYVLSDGNIGSVRASSGGIGGTIYAGYDDGVFNHDAFIQNVSTSGSFSGGIHASGSIGVISIDGDALGAAIEVNYDNIGPSGHVDLIDVTGDWGKVTSTGAVPPPSLKHGPGGDFGFIHVGGTINVLSGGWVGAATPTTYSSGETVTLNDDGGGRLTISPTITPVLDASGNPVYDPITHEPVVNIPTYSFIYIGVDDDVMPGGVGGVIAKLTINGPATLTVAAVVQLNDFTINTTIENAAITIGGSGRADIHNIVATGLSSFSNKTAGNLVSGSFDAIKSIAVAGSIGPRSGSVGEWLPGVMAAPTVANVEDEPQYGWFYGRVNGLNVTGALDSLTVGGSLGDLRVAGKIGKVVVNSDKKTSGTSWDGVQGIVWSDTRIDSISVGDGLADTGAALVAKAGIFCTKSIGTVSIVGPRYVRNGIVFGELDGAIIAGSNDILTLPGPTPTSPSVLVPVDAIGAITGTKGAVLDAFVGATDLDQFQILQHYRTLRGSVGTINFSGKGAKIANTEITGNFIRSIVASTDSDGIDNTLVEGAYPPANSQYVIGQVLAGGAGISDSRFTVSGGSLGWVKATAKTGVISGCMFAATDGLAGVSAHDISGTEFHMPGVIGSMTATGEIDTTKVFAGQLLSIIDKGDFTDNSFALAGLVGAATIGGSFVNSSLIVQGSAGADMRSLIVTGDISGTVLSGSHIGKIVSKKGSISANITTLGSGASSDIVLIQAARDFTGLLTVGGTLNKLIVGNVIGLDPTTNPGISQLHQIYGGLTQLVVGSAKGGSGDLFADFSIAGSVGSLTINGTDYGLVSIGGNLGKAVIGGDIGGLLDMDADGTPESLRGALNVYGGMTSLTLGRGGDILSDMAIGDTIGSIILKGGFIFGDVESRYGSIGKLQLTGGGSQGTITANSIGSITVTGGSIAGDIVARNGAIGTLTIKNGMLNADVTAENGTIGALKFTGATTTAGKTIFASAGINSVNVSGGNLLTDLLSRRDIKNVTVKGDLLGDIWADTGIGTIKVSGSIGSTVGTPLTIRSGGTIGSITAGRTANALVSSARDIVKVAISGLMAETDVMAGYDIGPDNAFGGGDDTTHAGSVGSATIGQMRNSIVAAGVGAGADGDFLLTGDNTYASGVSVIGKMKVKSGYTGVNGVLAETWVDPKYKGTASAGVTIVEQTPIYSINNLAATGVFGPLAGSTNLSYSADGMTMTLTGAGVAQYDSVTKTINLEQTNSSSRLVITGSAAQVNIISGDDSSLGAIVVAPQITVNTLSIDGVIGTLVVPTVDTSVTWTLPGGVGTANVGDPAVMDVTAGAVGAWSFGGAYTSGTFNAGAVGSFTVVGEMDATLNVDSATAINVTGNFGGTISSFGTLGTLGVGGTLGGNVNVYAGDLLWVVVGNGLTGVVNNAQQTLVDAGGNDVLYGGGQTTAVVLSNGDFGGGSDTSFRSALGIGSFSVSRGAFSGLLSSQGIMGSISVAGVMSGKVWSGLSVGSATFGGMLDGLLAASNGIGTVRIAGDMLTSWVLAGFDPGDAGYDAANGGEEANLTIDAFVSDQSWINADNRDIVYGGDVGSVTVSGAMTASTISSGVGPGTDGYYGTGDDFVGGAGSIGKVAVTGIISGSANGDEAYGVFTVTNWPLVTYMGGNAFSSNGNAFVDSYFDLLPGTLAVTGVSMTSNSIIVSLNTTVDIGSLTDSSFSLLGSVDDAFTTTDDMNSLVSYSFDGLDNTITITLLSGTWTTQPVDKFFRLTLTDTLRSNRGDQLDGEYNGTFQSGDGMPGGDFVYTLTSLTPSVTTITDTVAGGWTFTLTFVFGEEMDQTQDPTVTFPTEDPSNTIWQSWWSGGWTSETTYVATYYTSDANEEVADVDVEVSAVTADGVACVAEFADVFSIDTVNPTATGVTPSVATITGATVSEGTFALTVVFDHEMDQTVDPTISFPWPTDPTGTITLNTTVSGWTDSTTYVAVYDLANVDSALPSVDVEISGAQDLDGNVQDTGDFTAVFGIDTVTPTVSSITPSVATVTDVAVGTGTFTLTFMFDKDMDTTVLPTISFPVEDPGATITPNVVPGAWLNATTYVASYDVTDVNVNLPNVDVQITGAVDADGDLMAVDTLVDIFSIDTSNPTITSVTPSLLTIAEAAVGVGTFTLTIAFPVDMNTAVDPTITFPTPSEDPSGTITLNAGASGWLDATHYVASYDVTDVDVSMANIDVDVAGMVVASGSPIVDGTFTDVFSIDTVTPAVTSVTPSLVTIIDTTVGTGTFMLTVVFDKSMDTSVAPTISFPTENPAGTITPSATPGIWLNAVTYAAIYDVADIDTILTDVDVRVTGAKDAVGNTMVGSTLADIFSIDTGTPAITSMTPSPLTITDATAGTGAFSLTIVFGGSMNQSVAPTINFPTEDPSATITLNAGTSGWSNATTYVARYDVTDVNASLANVDVQVTGAIDAIGSVVADDTFSDVFSIYTINPSVTIMMPSVATIKDANVGSATFRLTLLFSENMNTSVAPTITFPVENPSATITPSAVPGVWVNATTYVAYYNVADVNTVMTNIDVRVAGAQNVAGNTQTPTTFVDKFSIDTLNP